MEKDLTKKLDEVVRNEILAIEEYKRIVRSSKDTDEVSFRAFIVDALKELKINIIKEKRETCGISTRKGVILALTHRLIHNNDRSFYNYDKVLADAKTSYNIKNRDKQRWNSLDKIYPENPCELYENKMRERGHYMRTLFFLIENRLWLIDHEDVTKLIVIEHNEVKHCGNK